VPVFIGAKIKQKKEKKEQNTLANAKILVYYQFTGAHPVTAGHGGQQRRMKMAWYNIDYACGCSGREQIYGTNRNGERDRKQAWLGTRDCKDCYAKKVASEKAAKTEAMLAAAPMVAAAAESKGCAPMVGGTPAQNAYAEILRAYVVDLADFAAKKILEKEEAGQQITDAQQSALGFPRTNLRVSLIRSVQKLSESHAKLFLQFSILDWDDITESMAPLLPGGVASVQSASTPPDEIRKIEMPPKLFETKIVRAAFELGATEIRRLVWPDDRVEFMFRPFWKTKGFV
jgi:hypothetical protein